MSSVFAATTAYTSLGRLTTGLVALVASCHSITMEFTSSWVTFSFTNVCRSSLHAYVLEFIDLWPWKGLEHMNSMLWMGDIQLLLLALYCIYSEN